MVKVSQCSTDSSFPSLYIPLPYSSLYSGHFLSLSLSHLLFPSLLSSKAPAIVDPGENTTTEVPEGGIRYFQVECDSFSNTVLVELYDNAGTSFLFCSATEQNPGPLTQDTIVNNTIGITFRTCQVTLANTNSRVGSSN